jgi:uncharacterized SAM-binding protein YcdF (DUF218 family)
MEMPVARPTPQRGSVRAAGRRPPHRTARSPRRLRLGSPYILAPALGLAAVLALLLSAALARKLARLSNTDRQTFDAIVVLGTPADSDGNPTPQMLDRVTEAVHEYDRGVAPRLIVSGGAAHNRFVEADVMARVAEAQGVPPSAIFAEEKAQDTIQNACYSAHILKEHGWRSVEVVTSPSHVPRAALIFSRLPLQWRVHAAPGNATPGYYSHASQWVEVIKTARYLAWARWTESCAP